MNIEALETTALAMLEPGKGLLAMDESTDTIRKRFDAVGIECTEETRRAYRELLVTTPGLNRHISAAILFDETLRQNTSVGRSFPAVLAALGILPGIKVDKRPNDLAGHPGEKVTEGLDGLRDRLAEYRSLGARFAKWRAVITIGETTPSRSCIEANAHALARYAALCQEADLVPIIEPEVLLDGFHSIARCQDVAAWTLHSVFERLREQRVHLEGTILKASMVLPGKSADTQASPDEIAQETLRCLRRSVPAAVPGVVFLSGGQTPLEATARLNAICRATGHPPWWVSFSYSRALQEPVMHAWASDRTDTEGAQRLLAHRARLNGLASLGRYDAAMEDELTPIAHRERAGDVRT